MKPRVYISVGSAASSTQLQATDLIFRSLEAAGLSPLQMERNKWTAEQPLRGIKKVIGQCDGIVVIAFQRYQFPSGTERQKNGSEKELADIRMTTIWNQIEAAIGYTKGLPLLVIAENGLLEDGLLEGRYDWKVFWSDFSPEQLRSDAFIGYLESWKQLVLDCDKSERDLDLSKMSALQVIRLFGKLTVPQLWAAASAFLALLGGIAAIAFHAGAGKWPWH
ncbi:hypothetical protein [Alloacidobacterium sp.]|uniref:hypothetical protein n=1 Tax=Alloacidobacterium sp. TaxID=2951999 RepID=UPI002D78B205|nr:hypothetical protein [Alloacidobacterium sp.]